MRFSTSFAPGLPVRLSLFLFFVAVFAAPVHGWNARDGASAIQPVVILVFDGDPVDDTMTTMDAQHLLEAAVEAELRSSLRYALVRRLSSAAPEAYLETLLADPPGGDEIDAVVFVRSAPRRDGSIRVELDIWREGRFIWSLESRLPLGRERFSIVSDLAQEVQRELAESFSGFGRISFRNTGHPEAYYLYVDDALVGVDLSAIELLPGTYTIEVRRRDDAFEHVIGRRSVSLEADSFVEVRFAMEADPPAVPTLLRLTDPTQRWTVLLNMQYAVLVPVEGFDGAFGTSHSASATALFNDVLFRGHAFGFEAAYQLFDSTMPGRRNDAREVEITSLLATTGLSAGPIAGADIVVRGGAGVAFTRVSLESDADDDNDTEIDRDGEIAFDDPSPTAAGSMDIGFGIGRYGRLSLGVSYSGVYQGGQWFTALGFGGGLGLRF